MSENKWHHAANEATCVFLLQFFFGFRVIIVIFHFIIRRRASGSNRQHKMKWNWNDDKKRTVLFPLRNSLCICLWSRVTYYRVEPRKRCWKQSLPFFAKHIISHRVFIFSLLIRRNVGRFLKDFFTIFRSLSVECSFFTVFSCTATSVHSECFIIILLLVLLPLLFSNRSHIAYRIEKGISCWEN